MYADINDLELYYETEGSGRPLIMVHGNSEDHTIFSESAEILKDRFTCYLPDSRGHGKSLYKGALHYADMADDMVAFMEKLDLRDVLFYGFSDGGIIGLLAAMKTDRITTLVTSGANLTPEGVKTYMQYLIRALDFVLHDPKMKLMKEEPHITAEQLQTIRIPALVLAGEHDVIREEETKAIAAGIPGSELKIIKGESHGSYIVHSTKLVKYLVYADTLSRK